jgi:hypothetical protein
MFAKEIFETKDGFGYRLYENGSVCVVQEYAPGMDGYAAMTLDEASALADRDIAQRHTDAGEIDELSPHDNLEREVERLRQENGELKVTIEQLSCEIVNKIAKGDIQSMET